MSIIVGSLAQKRKVGSPTRKSILMYMSSYASHDGSGVWVSKEKMARDLEMGKRTVQISINDLAKHGLISEVGTRKCSHGYTIEYRLKLNAIRGLELTNPNRSKPVRAKVAENAPVQNVHPARTGDASQDVQDVHPNHPSTIQEPVCSDGVTTETDKTFDCFWKACPRPRDRQETARLFEAAIKAGTDASLIIAAAKAYNAEHIGNSRQYVAYSDTWLKKQRWNDYGTGRSSNGSDRASEVELGYQTAIQQGNAALARHCPMPTVLALIEARKITADQCSAVGLSLHS